MLGPPLHSLRKVAQARDYRSDYTDRLLSVAKALQSAKVPTVFTLMHLSKLCAVPWHFMRSVVQRKIDPYHVFMISKKSGGGRRICAPSPKLKRVQNWIHSTILCSPGSLSRLHQASTAYAPKSSIRDNAGRHVGAEWMVKIDIMDFFESISERQVYRVFRDLNYPALLSFEFARVCTRIAPPRRDGTRRKRDQMWRWNNCLPQVRKPYGMLRPVGHLPQGAPTSAMLANLVFSDLDVKVQRIADSHGATYSRYADDLVLLWNKATRKKCELVT